MGRPSAGVLLIVAAALLPSVAAITDPEGDVVRGSAGDPVVAPFVDIREADGAVLEGRIVFVMRLAGPATDAPADTALRFLWPFALDGDPDDNLYGKTDGTILCTFDVTPRTLSCYDTSRRFAVVAAAREGATVRATVDLAGAQAPRLAVAGATALLEDTYPSEDGIQGNVTAQDFTSNALPPQPGAPDGSAPPTPDPWWRTWRLAVLLLAATGLAVWAWRR